MASKRNKLILACLSLLLASCSLSLERQGGEQFLMTLPTAPLARHEAPRAEALTVHLPSADTVLDTRRIALRRADGAFDYYAGARWADFLPVMVRDALVQSLERYRPVRTVTSDEHPTSGRWRLYLALEDFEAVYRTAGQPPVINIRLSASLYDNRRDHTQSFTAQASEPAPQDRMPAIAQAFSHAFESAQRDLALQLGDRLK